MKSKLQLVLKVGYALCINDELYDDTFSMLSCQFSCNSLLYSRAIKRFKNCFRWIWQMMSVLKQLLSNELGLNFAVHFFAWTRGKKWCNGYFLQKKIVFFLFMLINHTQHHMFSSTKLGNQVWKKFNLTYFYVLEKSIFEDYLSRFFLILSLLTTSYFFFHYFALFNVYLIYKIKPLYNIIYFQSFDIF